MRPVSLAELGLLARVLLSTQRHDQYDLARRLLFETATAASHLHRTGRAHRQFGDGSLMARCLPLCPVLEPPAQDPAFLSALITACHALRDHSGS